MELKTTIESRVKLEMKKVFDAHVHHSFEMSIKDAIRIFKLEFPVTNTERKAFMSMPNKVSPQHVFYHNEMQNIRVLFLKHCFSPTAYAFAGLEHPIDVYERDDAYLSDLYLKQAEEYASVGFDGMKMLEGYPSLRKAMKRPLNHSVYDKYYSFLEENNIPVTMHVANPENFWNIEEADEYAIKMGRVCDSTYPTKEELHDEVDGIMKKHPRLRLTLAHFGFMSTDIERAKRWLDYENTCFDITPGGEQLLKMGQEWDKWQSFFSEYQDRIVYGSDYYAFPEDEKWEENFTRRPNFIRQFFETDTEHVYLGEKFFGVNLDRELIEKIYWNNSMRLLGEPKKIDYSYMKSLAQSLLAKSGKYSPFADEDLRYILESID